ILAWWKEREPRYRALADRSASRADREMAMAGGGRTAAAGPDGDTVDEPAEKTRRAASPAPAAKTDTVAIAPRPRQQKARKRK
ncbi:MAG: hypothetical protein ABIP21_13115, partial [Acidimicrobiia bacterium]